MLDNIDTLFAKQEIHSQYTIKPGLSNARIEAMNNKIKQLICKAYGFRNIQNMMYMVYLLCSSISETFPNLKSLPIKTSNY